MNISMSKKMTAQSNIICNYGHTLMMWMQHKCKITPNLILVVNEVKQFFKISDAEYKKLKHHICVYSHTYVSSLTAGQECFMPKPEPPPWALPGSSVQNGHIHLHKTHRWPSSMPQNNQGKSRRASIFKGNEKDSHLILLVTFFSLFPLRKV